MTAISKVYNWLKDGNEITGDQIALLIKDNRMRHDKQIQLYERYKGTKEGVPILTREYPIEDTTKINNKIANDFFSEIIDTKTGYMAGRPVTYGYDTDQNVKENFDDFILRNSVPDLDSESIKMAAIAGFSARYCYINPDGAVSMINVPPWECIFISDEMGVTDAPYAIRYYTVDKGDTKYTKAEFFDSDIISFWIREEDPLVPNNDPFVMDTSEPANPQNHFMNGCPVICFPNNEEMQGDCEKILTLIDGYDRTLSDVNSEIEQFRLAYLALYGINISDETIEQMRQTGCISIPEAEGRAEFLTKNLNDMVVENHLNRLEENIYMLSKSVKITDQSFAANTSGVAMRYKMFGLESKCITTERKFTKAMYQMFNVLLGYFDKRGITYDPWQIKFTWVRNFPLDLQSEASTLSMLAGQVSQETAFSQMSFISNPLEEIARMKAEQEEYLRANQDIMAAEAQNGMQNEGEGQETEEVSPTENPT